MRNAFAGVEASRVADDSQPKTRRDRRSMKTARCSQPSPVRMASVVGHPDMVGHAQRIRGHPARVAGCEAPEAVLTCVVPRAGDTHGLAEGGDWPA